MLGRFLLIIDEYLIVIIMDDIAQELYDSLLLITHNISTKKVRFLDKIQLSTIYVIST